MRHQQRAGLEAAFTQQHARQDRLTRKVPAKKVRAWVNVFAGDDPIRTYFPNVIDEKEGFAMRNRRYRGRFIHPATPSETRARAHSRLSTSLATITP